MMKQMRNAAYFLSTLGFIGKLPGAHLWGSLLGLPVLFIGRISYTFVPVLFWSIIGVGFLLLTGVAFYTRTFATEEQEEDIILDRALGLILALAFLPVDFLQLKSLKFMVFGIILYHLWLFFSLIMQRLYGNRDKSLDFDIVLHTGEIMLIGLLTNTLLRFLWWVTH